MHTQFDKGDNDSPYRIGKAIVSSTNTSGKADETSKHCGVSNLNPTLKTDIANKLLSLVEQYRAHWLSRLKQYLLWLPRYFITGVEIPISCRYHPHGLRYSLAVLSNLLKQLIPDGPDVVL